MSLVFRKTDPQLPLLTTDRMLPESAQRRLRDSWAVGFSEQVMPLLLASEERFAALYSTGVGRPNWSVARMLGLLLLQELHDMDDQTALDALSFDLRWQHALGVSAEEAYLSRRSFVDFRSRMVAVDPEMEGVRELFDKVTAAAVEDLGLSTAEQRIDSTLVRSNIVVRGRVDLFRRTLEHFLAWLSKHWPERMGLLSEGLREWFAAGTEGWFAAKGRDEPTKRKQLKTLASWLHEVAKTFAGDKEVTSDERYQLVVRLLREHCSVTVGRGGGSGGGSGGGGGGADDCGEPEEDEDTTTPAEPEEVEVLSKPERPSTSLQSPHDPDATLGRKGPGYQLHVTETSRNRETKGTEMITDFEVVGAGESDKDKSTPVLDRLARRNMLPQTLYADGGYVTGEALVEAEARGVILYGPATLGRLAEDIVGRDQFEFDEATGEVVRCPSGHRPLCHQRRQTRGKRGLVMHAYFSADACDHCALAGRCLARGPHNGKRAPYTLELCPELRARDRRLSEQRDDGWWPQYSIRSGIEGTNSELKGRHGAGRLRVRHRPRVELALTMKVTACNVKRWLRARQRAASAEVGAGAEGGKAGPGSTGCRSTRSARAWLERHWQLRWRVRPAAPVSLHSAQ
jgi:hypothetical protein